jgi:hypothetical protein
MQFSPPPGWPPAPAGWTPPPGWQPDPSWPPPPPGWQLWVDAPAPAPVPTGRPVKKIAIISAGSVLAVIVVLAIVGAIAGGGGSGSGGSTSATSILQSDGYTEFPAANPNSADSGPFATETPATNAADGFLPFQAAYAASGGSEASGYTGSASSPVMMQDVVTLPGNGMTMMSDDYTNGITGLQSEAAASGVTISVSGDVVTITGTASAFDTLANSGGDF